MLNISEHLTRAKVQTGNPSPNGLLLLLVFSHVAHSITVLGALLGTQNGRDIEIVNSFELALTPTTESGEEKVDHEFLAARRDQCEYPSLKNN